MNLYLLIGLIVTICFRIYIGTPVSITELTLIALCWPILLMVVVFGFLANISI